jgi:hypothetical protein
MDLHQVLLIQEFSSSNDILEKSLRAVIRITSSQAKTMQGPTVHGQAGFSGDRGAASSQAVPFRHHNNGQAPPGSLQSRCRTRPFAPDDNEIGFQRDVVMTGPKIHLARVLASLIGFSSA